MRIKFGFILALTAFLLSSCATSTYYQVYKAAPDEKIVEQDNYLVYEDENCEVIYNLWKDGGDIGFVFRNKSDKTILLNMEESYFLKNGIAYDYYLNRVFTTSSQSGVNASNTYSGYKYLNLFSTVESTESTEHSVSYGEKKIVRIPSNSAKIIAEYNISEALFRDCDLLKYPNREKDISTLKFDKSGSPLVFSNRLVYYLEQSVTPIAIENEFYVSEITNYPKDMMGESNSDEFCGEKSTTPTFKLNYLSPYHFYLIYKKGTDALKH